MVEEVVKLPPVKDFLSPDLPFQFPPACRKLWCAIIVMHLNPFTIF
jgi:hypothetical protein